MQDAPAVGICHRLAQRQENLEQAELLDLARVFAGSAWWYSSMTFCKVRPLTNFIT